MDKTSPEARAGSARLPFSAESHSVSCKEYSGSKERSYVFLGPHRTALAILGAFTGMGTAGARTITHDWRRQAGCWNGAEGLITVDGLL